jgi:hypothetical protein
MRFPNRLISGSLPCFAVALALLSLPACSVNVKKDAEGKDKNVDIETPMGDLHVSEKADVRDTGLTPYPGAKEKPKENNDDTKQANVNISGPGFSVKVVAIEYASSDPPQKLVDFYKNDMKKYGNVIECHTSKHDGNVNMHSKDGDKGDEPVTCEGNDGGKTVELKVGTRSNQHVVSIEPDGSGSNFALVFVRTHGKDNSI